MKWYFVACIFLLVSKSVQSKSSQQILDEVKEIAKKSCTAENAKENKFYFPHPEKEKFIQCDEWGNYHVMQCAPGTAWSQKVYTCDRENSIIGTPPTVNTPTTTKSTITNPCTKENIDAGRFYFAYSNENFFIYCNKWGAYCVMPCAPGTKWLQVIESCVADDSNVKTTTTTKYDITNPCTKENIDAGIFYQPHPNRNYFIQCDQWGKYHVMQCAPGTAWSQKAYTCDRDNSIIGTQPTTTTIKNPCTKENIDAGRFYFAHSNENFFIYCNKWGAYCVMQCAPGTIWLQDIGSCVAGDSIDETTESDITNPCTKENIDAGIFYHPHPDKNFFIQCDMSGNYFVRPCAPGTQWSQSAYTCV